jgi:TolA-binding protein
MRRNTLPAFFALTLGISPALLGGPARADEVDKLGGKVIELDSRMVELDRQLKPPLPPGPEKADSRLIDAQVLYELKNYEMAAIILYDIVEKYPNSPAYPEALFYLADSLFQKRDYLSSRRFFEKIVEQGPTNPRYQESLQRLIDLSLHTGDYSPVDGYIAKLDQLPSDKQLPSVPYVKGKYFFFRQQYPKALDAMRAIGPTHVYYFHSLYFVGASYVAMGTEHLPEALQTFGTILKTEPKTDSQKKIAELAHLALARIFMDRGQYTNALDEYARIGIKSDLFNDALYESAWVSIKSKDYAKAARSLDLLLLNAPESPLAPEVRLLIGQLQIRQDSFSQATDTFTKTRSQYEPIHNQLKDAVAKLPDAPAYFRDLINQNLTKFDTAAILPAASVKWMKQEENVGHVSTLIGDEAELKKSLDDAEEIVKRLEKAMNGPARVNVFPDLARARTRGAAISNETTQVKSELAYRMSKLIAPVSGADQELKALEAERDAIEAKLRQLPTTSEGIAERQTKARAQFNALDMRVVELLTQLNGVRASAVATRKYYHDQIESTLPPGQRAAAQKEIEGFISEVDGENDSTDKLRRDLDDARQSVGVDDADMQQAQLLKAKYDDVLRRMHDLDVRVCSRLSPVDRARAEQIESILDRARGVETKVAAFNGRIDAMLDERLKDIQSELNDEKAHVAIYRQQLGGYTSESADVGGGIMAESLKAVAQRFYNVVVRADVGIIDVAWALKDSSTRNDNRLVAERKRELKLLDDEFKEVLKDQP